MQTELVFPQLMFIGDPIKQTPHHLQFRSRFSRLHPFLYISVGFYTGGLQHVVAVILFYLHIQIANHPGLVNNLVYTVSVRFEHN